MEILFVHFGPKIPKYLRLNIQRTCKLFPNQKVVLISDFNHPKLKTINNFSVLRIKSDAEYDFLNSLLSHPKEFRNNFWFSSLARLLAIADYAIEVNCPIMHVESDVLLSKDFPFSELSKLDRQLAYPLIGENSGVASVMMILDKKSAQFLKSFIRASIMSDTTTTDMRILGQLQSKHPEMVRAFASFPLQPSENHSAMAQNIEEDFVYSENLLNGYIDAADIGQFLLGDDPRNHRGIKYLNKELPTSYLRASRLNYSYDINREFISLPGNKISKIYALHVHSKNSKVFSEKTTQSALHRACTGYVGGPRRVLVLRVLFSSIIRSIERRIRKHLKRSAK